MLEAMTHLLSMSWDDSRMNRGEGKKEEMILKILEGKEKKFREEASLLTQPFVKNPEQTIESLIKEKIGKIGENIQVGGFSRLEM